MTRKEARYYLQSSGFSEEQMDTIEQAFTCEDAISRQAVCDYIAEFVNNEYSTQAECDMVDLMIKGIKHLPSVTQKSGKWIEQEGWDGDVYYDCSVCGESWTTIDGTPWDNGMSFCPNCGADMRGDT